MGRDAAHTRGARARTAPVGLERNLAPILGIAPGRADSTSLTSNPSAGHAVAPAHTGIQCRRDRAPRTRLITYDLVRRVREPVARGLRCLHGRRPGIARVWWWCGVLTFLIILMTTRAVQAGPVVVHWRIKIQKSAAAGRSPGECCPKTHPCLDCIANPIFCCSPLRDPFDTTSQSYVL